MEDGEFELLACGVIRTEPHTAMHLRLRELFEDLRGLIREFEPDTMAVEKLFFGRNVTNAISVGQARGTALLAAALHDLELAEYTPAEVKQAIVPAMATPTRQQIQEMVRRLLDLPTVPGLTTQPRRRHCALPLADATLPAARRPGRLMRLASGCALFSGH